MLDRRVKEDRVISACRSMIANELIAQGVITTDTLIVLDDKPTVAWETLQLLKDGSIELPTRGRLPRQLKYAWSVKGWDNHHVGKAVELLIGEFKTLPAFVTFAKRVDGEWVWKKNK